MSDDRRNPPLALDLPFGEALERFIGVDRNELAFPPRERAAQQKGPPVLTWIKHLSKTDAQAETSGGLVPYLRLTKSSLTKEDFQTWFRDTFFAGGAWVAGTFGKEQVERKTVPFEVTVRDLNFGTEAMLVTHGAARQDSHSTPNTWLHWSPNLQNLFSLNDFTGKPVRMTRDDNGVYHLDIDSAADA